MALFSRNLLQLAKKAATQQQAGARTASLSPFSLYSSSRSSRLASTLVLSEPIAPDGTVPAATCSTVAAAKILQEKATSSSSTSSVALLVVGEQAPKQVPEGVTTVLFTSASPDSATAETVAAAIVKAASEASTPYDYVLGSSTKFGNTVVPRAAAMLNVSPISDVVAVEAEDTFIRPMYAGNALARVQATKDPMKVMTIRPTSFEKVPLQDASAVGTEEVAVEAFTGSTWVGASVSAGSDRPDLASASNVVSGGRGMQSGDNFVLLEKLADRIGQGAVGASRAAVDAGMVPNDMQVGQTGKVVAPNLYVAVGISGAIQHLSGMKDSKTIVAINKDPDAPIFQVADYGLVADLFEAVPEMTEKL